MFKKLLRVILWSTATLVLLLTVVTLGIRFYVRTDHFHALLRTQILSSLNDSLKGEVQFNKVGGSLWSGLMFHDVAVSQERSVILYAPLVSIEVGLLEQLYMLFSSSKIRVGEIKITAPKMTLVQDKEKKWNVLSLLKERDETEPPATLRISLSKITIENGQVYIKTADGKESDVNSLSATGKAEFLPASVDIAVDRFKLALIAAGLPRATLDGALSIQTAEAGSSLSIKRVNVLTGESRLSVSGSVSQLSNPEINLDIDIAKLSSKELISLFPSKLGFVSAGTPRATLDGALSIQTAEAGSSLSIKRVNVLTGESRLSVSGSVSQLSNPEVKLDIEIAKVSAKELTSLFPSLPLRQDVLGRLRASGPFSALELSGRLVAPDGLVTVSMVGDWDASEPQLQGKLEFQDFIVDKVLTVTEFKGKVNGQADFRGGSYKQLQVSIRGNISSLAVDQWQIGDVSLTGRFKDQSVQFEAESDDKAGNAKLEASIALTEIPSYEGTLRARSLDLKKVTGKREDLPAGKISLDAWIKGRGTQLDSLQADAKLTFYPSRIGDIQIDEGRAEGSVRDGALVLRQANFVANKSTLNVKGRIASVAQPRSGSLAYNLDLKDLKPWLKFAGLEGSGKAEITGTISGSLEAPRLDGKATVNELRVDGKRVASGNARWTLASSAKNDWQGKLNISARELLAGIPLQSLEADITLDGMRPAKLSAEIAVRDPDKRVHRVRGRLLHSDERTEMTLQELYLQLPNGIWRNPEPVRLIVAENAVRMDKFHLTRGQQTLTAEGNAAFSGDQDMHFRVSQFPISDLRPYLKDSPDIAGILSMTMRVKGTAAQPLIETRMNVDDLSLAGQAYAGLTAEASYAKERVNLNLRLFQDQSHHLDINGTLPVYFGWGGNRSPALLGDTDLRIHSQSLSTAFLNVIRKDMGNLKGNLSVDINLRGPVRALTANGTMRFREGAVSLRPLGLSLTEIDLQTRLTPNAVHITRAVVRSGDGRLSGSGEVAYNGFSLGAIRLAMQANGAQVINTREYKAKASGNLLVAGSWQEPSVTGSLDLKAALRPDIALLQTNGKAARDSTILVVQSERDLVVPQGQTKEKTKAKKANGALGSEEENPIYRKLRLDVTAAIARDTWLYLDDGSVELTGQLRARKAPGEKLTLTGDVDAVRGSYSFKGRRFQIDKAHLNFSGGDDLDPRLNIVGRHRAFQYRIEFAVEGYASKPTLTLRSDPPLDQADILSVLLFGKPVKALTEGEQVSLQRQAVLATADFLAADLKRSIADRLGLDTLDVDVGDGVSGGQIGVGKYITEDVFVSTKQQIGGERGQEYAIEYNITPEWQIKSSTDPEGKSAVDLFWRKRY